MQISVDFPWGFTLYMIADLKDTRKDFGRKTPNKNTRNRCRLRKPTSSKAKSLLDVFLQKSNKAGGRNSETELCGSSEDSDFDHDSEQFKNWREAQRLKLFGEQSV